MIRGIVTPQREAVIRLRIRGAKRAEQEVDAVIDTGFNDSLTLSPAMFAELGLRYAALAQAKLADRTIVEAPYYRAKLHWDGTLRDVLVLAIEGGALVGMSLLYRHELFVRVEDGGTVTIQAIE